MLKSSLSEDTLLRMLIIGIAALLERLTTLRSAGQFAQARAEIDQHLQKTLGFSGDIARRIGDDAILEALTLGDVLDVGALYSVAELFYAEGQLLEAQHNPVTATARLVRALNFHLEVAFAAPGQFPEGGARIDELEQSLGHAIPEETLFTLASYYELAGRYRDVERILDRMLAISEDQASVVEEQNEFYWRLSQKTDTELVAGGLDRRTVAARLGR